MNPLATIEELKEATLRNLAFAPTEEQSKLVDTLCKFVLFHQDTDVYILNGYAGSGKTSIIAALVKGMHQYHLKHVLLAPTGRAAKVISGYGGGQASTIHKRIYRATSPDPTARDFMLASNNSHDTIFIVDEASMVTDGGDNKRSVLRNLVEYVYSADNCALIMVGDTAQLPPPGEEISAAMSPSVLRSLGLRPFGTTLETSMRQQIGSGILFNATRVRESLTKIQTEKPLPYLEFKPFDDIHNISPIDLADELSSSWGKVGKDQTLIITRSNRMANLCNRDVRNRVLYADEALVRGERIVIGKNDYYWGKRNKVRDFIANGETAIVEWIGSIEKAHGMEFADVELRMVSDDSLIGAKLMLDSLFAEGPNISRSEMQQLYRSVLETYPEGTLSTLLRKGSEDPYFNALQAKYAYCVTCHKAQGGQWKHVYIDMTGLAVTPDTLQEFIRWLYTAMTRATEQLYLVGCRLPSDESEDMG
ncbi:MAG: AAA family ATPase [Prevotella sp.]|nr:AAA family ATPase [Bacteroides sp.]MCM1365926.1 AAA family ATPase [Prevotella sp.]MCM1436653.1 AAA family ATPase [Prevotella sp.]